MNAMTNKNDDSKTSDRHVAAGRRSVADFFQLPAPVKGIFDKFPLKTYPSNDLPCRSPQIKDANVLHVFTTKEGASQNAPSFNPACLKWQVKDHSPPMVWD
jgi:metaxin